MKKIKLKIKTENDEGEWVRHLNVDQIDEINDNLSFVSAVLDAINAIGDSHSGVEINGRTLLCLASEAEEKMEKISKVINAQ